MICLKDVWVQAVKEKIYAAFCEAAGGKEEFEDFLKALIESILIANLDILSIEKERYESSKMDAQ